MASPFLMKADRLRPWAPLIGGSLLGLTILGLLASEPEQKFEDIGLGKRTSSVFLPTARGPFHCSSDPAPCIAAALGQEPRPTTLWLGASQLHGVNSYIPGEFTAPYLLEASLQGRGERLIALSPPNANAREHLVLFEAVQGAMPLSRLMVGAVLDDAGEGLLRPSIVDLMSESPVRRALQKTSAGRLLLAGASRSDAPPGARPTEDKSELGHEANLQEQSEAWLDCALGDALPLWAARESIRGRIYVALDMLRWQFIRLRSWITGRPLDDWVTPISPVDYAANLTALEALAESAQSAGIETLIYIAPRPSTDRFPYDPNLYLDFKERLSALASRYGASFANLEDAVIGDVWGTFEMAGGVERRDIFHFTAAGHKQLYEALRPLVTRRTKAPLD